MGVNGAGKSTLLKLVAGETQPDAGSVTLGASVKLGYFAQHAMELLDADDDRASRRCEARSRWRPSARCASLAGAFGFSGDDVEKSCRVLSGGEKARLVLARMLYDPPNFLVLDEPTNHLDMATKEMLMKALADFEGTMLFVSHDRQFLGALSNRVLELDARRRRTCTAAATPSTSPHRPRSARRSSPRFPPGSRERVARRARDACDPALSRAP